MLSYRPVRVTHIVHDYVSDMFPFIEWQYGSYMSIFMLMHTRHYIISIYWASTHVVLVIQVRMLHSISSLLRDWPTASLHRQAVVYGNLLTWWAFLVKRKKNTLLLCICMIGEQHFLRYTILLYIWHKLSFSYKLTCFLEC